jgi:hypothetical protein
MVDRILAHNRHHHDSNGQPWWIQEELAESLDLVEIEESREGAN